MTYKEGEQIHIEDDEASAGQKTGVMRYVLLISLLAAIAVLSMVWISGAATSDTEIMEDTRVGETMPADADPGIVDDALEAPENDDVVGGSMGS